MIRKTLAVLSLFFLVSTSVGKGVTNDASAQRAHREFQDVIMKVAREVETSPALQQDLEKNIRRVEAAEFTLVPIEYHCDPFEFGPSEENPTSVHRVRPADVKVVAAFGDSVTACNGCGARNLVELAFTRRGETWSAGSDRNMNDGWVTLPNLLSEFGANPAGYSTCMSPQYSNNAWFNVAMGGARNVHMPGQATNLVQMMKEDPTINFEEDWKVYTLFIGGNDLCGYCNNPGQNNAQNYRDNIELAIDTIMNNVPRSIFNIATMFDVTPLGNLSTGFLCNQLQAGFCSCALNETMIPVLRDLQHQYYLQMEDLVSQPKYKGRSDFTVIHQTQMRDIHPYDEKTGEWLKHFLSVDCFHPNRLGHRAMAYWLWNAMLWPIGQKPTDQDLKVDQFDICCPSEEFPYIFTYENSEGVPQNPWTHRGQACWEPAGASKTPHKRVSPIATDMKAADKLAKRLPLQPIRHEKRVRRSRRKP